MGTQKADQLYHLDTPNTSMQECAFSAVHSPMLKLEQLRLVLGHLNYPSIISMLCKGLICGISLSQRELSITPPQCNACMKGKATRASFPASKSRQAESVLGLVHSDLWGPSPVTSIDRMHYMLTLTDDKSQWLWVIFLKSKGEALKTFVNWPVYV